jgi:hypothetical protein
MLSMLDSVIEQPKGLMGKLVRRDCFKITKVTP